MTKKKNYKRIKISESKLFKQIVRTYVLHNNEINKKITIKRNNSKLVIQNVRQ